MSAKCLVAEDATTTKSELDEIMQIMASVCLKSEEQHEEKKSAPTAPARAPTPPPEAPAAVVMEKKAEEESHALDKALLGEADPYFKSSDDETATYI